MRVLSDYHTCPEPSAREPEVLSTMATIINRLDVSTVYLFTIISAVNTAGVACCGESITFLLRSDFYSFMNL